MQTRELLDALLSSQSIKDLEDNLRKFRLSHGDRVTEIPVGRRANNRGAIEVASDAGRSAIERVTNAQDAILELEYFKHSGKPECRSPKEAASAWVGVPFKEGLAGLSVKARQDIAEKNIVRLESGEGVQSRLLTVIDEGIGISPDRLEDTILSLNESNKIQKHYLAGTYGQGGSSTFAFCRHVLIVSRKVDTAEIVFTIVRYLDLPADSYKTGHYVYLVLDEKPLTCTANNADIKHGTVIRHFGFDLSNYTSPIGPKSLYGVLQRVLFDPVLPIRLENKVHGWNRVIKGVRNALNGAIDQEDEGKGPDLDHHLPMFHVSLGDFGDLGVEYWLLKRPTEGRKNIPADSFVDSRKPIILTHNGQNQGEISALLIKREADLPYLRNRLIVQVNCDRLSPAAKRQLFSSTREQSREGYLSNRVQEELVNLLKSDDELRRYNEEARESSLNEQDESAKQQMKKQVARLLRITGASLQPIGGAGNKPGTTTTPTKPRPPRPKPEPISTQDPPSYIKILWEEDSEIKFYPGQRRYLRIETDANSDYHDADKPENSKINIAVGENLKLIGTSPLTGGRMRIGIECLPNVGVGGTGSIRVELYRKGLSTLSDEAVYRVVEIPAPKDNQGQTQIPDFTVTAVEGPGDDKWQYISETGEEDVSRHSSGMVFNDGVLMIYYSMAFPRFATEHKRLSQQDTALSLSFKNRYELWLAVHALMMYQDDKTLDNDGLDEDSVAEMRRQERCRFSIVAAMTATQEIRTGITIDAEAA